MRIPFALDDTLSPDRVGYNRSMDTLKLKLGLRRLGFYEQEDDTFIPAGTNDVWSALRDFQRARGLKVDAVAKPDGPTVRAMNAALAKIPARPVIRDRIPSATSETVFKNERTVRGMGGYVDSGDYPAFMASALHSKDGSRAGPEVADLLKQTRTVNPKQGAHMRARLAELLDPEDMDKIEIAAGVPEEERAAPGTREKRVERVNPEPEAKSRPLDSAAASAVNVATEEVAEQVTPRFQLGEPSTTVSGDGVSHRVTGTATVSPPEGGAALTYNVDITTKETPDGPATIAIFEETDINGKVNGAILHIERRPNGSGTATIMYPSHDPVPYDFGSVPGDVGRTNAQEAINSFLRGASGHAL